jgi:dTDP-4-dehydrorhamnose 3,5-epimerase
MIFIPTRLAGATLIEPERREDSRGHFARVYCEREFQAHGLPARVAQANRSLTLHRGTLRGMHCQLAPHGEDKLVRCEKGAIWDCIVDLRPESATYCQWVGVELSEHNGRMLLVPQGFAHGFLTLSENVAVSYQVSAFYTPGAERGVRYDDAAFGIDWPAAVLHLSDKDAAWPAFVREEVAA